MAKLMPSVRPIWLILLACGLLALSFGWPLLTHISATGIWDWSEAAAHFEATRHTVFTYGQFPLWNPYVCGGGPSLGNPQTYWLSITGLFALMFGSIVGPKIAAIVYVFLGGLGIWLLMRLLKISRTASLIAMPVFLTSGYLATHLSAGQFLWLNLAWVPFVWLGYLKSASHSRWILFGAFFLAMIGLEGRSYLVAYLLVMLLAYGLMADLVGTSRRSLIRAALLLVAAFIMGAWKFIPDIYFLALAEGSLPNTYTVPLSLLPKMFLLRDVSPNAEYAAAFFKTPQPWFEFGYYLGIVPLLLAAWGVIHAIKKRHYIPWIFVGIIMATIALGSGDNNILELAPFLRELRNQQRAVSMVIFIIAILAAVGLDQLRKRLPVSRKVASSIAIIVISLVALDLASVTRPALAEGYKKIAIKQAGEIQHIQPLITQGEGFNNPWPLVSQNRGAARYCPAILNAWYSNSSVNTTERQDYQGEVYLAGPGLLKDFLITPNTIKASVTAEFTTLLVVNQNANPGWRTSIGQIVDHNQLLTAQLPPGQHNVVISYRPPGLILGLLIFVAGLTTWLVLELRLKYRISKTTQKHPRLGGCL